MSDVEWITREEWMSLVNKARSLMKSADWAKQRNDNLAYRSLWKKIAPLNKRIRSDKLKVRGIDDRKKEGNQ